MKISVEWLKNYVDFDFTPAELAERLMMVGFEVESITDLSESSELRDDVVMEIEVTPNRPDCLSVIGIAREISAMTGNPLQMPKIDFQENSEKIKNLTSITIEAPDLCPRYAARIIRNVQVAESPQWLQNRLRSIGAGPINNVVDVTNFILRELGQPMHAFDFNKLAENRIVVRRAASGEIAKTLEETTHDLPPETLVIADAEETIAIAGIIGSLDSAVSDRTVDVLLESANFNPISIRKTSKNSGIGTESSYRFERGVDPEGVIFALDRAAQLIAEMTGGEIVQGAVDIYPGKSEPTKIKLRPDRVNFVLGTEIEAHRMGEILSKLGFKLDKNFEVTVPTFRPDIEREIDLIEEIARSYGYDNIPITLPKGNIPLRKEPIKSRLRKTAVNYLLSSGMSEAINYSFYSKRNLEMIGLPEEHPFRDAIEIKNPLNEDFAVLRPTLLPSLLENVRRNFNHRQRELQFFEVSRVFMKNPKFNLPFEPETIAGVMAGKTAPESYGSEHRSVDFFDLKGKVEGLLEVFGISDYALIRSENPTFHPGRSAKIEVDGETIVVFGEIHPSVLKNYDLNDRIYAFEVSFDKIIIIATPHKNFEPISPYPTVTRDLAIVVDAEIPASMPLKIIQSVGSKLSHNSYLFDLYVGEQIPEGKKSLAYRIEYQSHAGTLTDEQVDRLHAKIMRHLESELEAVRR